MLNIVVVGLSHNTAPVETRERFVFSDGDLEEALCLSLQDDSLKECVIISTCNRTEIYAVTDEVEQGQQAILNMIQELKGVSRTELKRYIFFLCRHDAVQHLFKVAAGLDSMILGETQILGQVKEAYERADKCGSVGKVFHALFRKSLSCGKRVHSETKINQNAASVSYASVELARKIFSRLNQRSVLVIGAGKMSELTLRHLYDHGATEIFVINRTRSRAERLALSFNGTALDYESLSQCLTRVDIAISSTGAPHQIIDKPIMTRIMHARKNRPLFLIDIAVPRDIDPAVNELSDVYLYDIDDLRDVVASNIKEREKEAARASLIIAEEAAGFRAWFDTLEVIPFITALRGKSEAARCHELEKMLSGPLSKLSPKEKKAVENLTKAVTNRILREPVLRIKEFAARKQSHHYLTSLCYLFDLEGYMPGEQEADNSEPGSTLERGKFNAAR